MSHEKWLVTGLSLTVITILSLAAALTWKMAWSTLAIMTLVFVLSYPLIWLAWRCYHFWCQTIMQLTTYTQVLRENETNLSFKKQHPDNLLLELQKEIHLIATKRLDSNKEQKTLNHILSNILDSWPIPVCLFDQQLKLLYRNEAMNQQIAQPMLVNNSAQSLGFSLENEQFLHEKFNNKWQSQTISYQLNNNQYEKQWLFTSINISPLLNQQQSHNQQNLIRVLSHELRNSLTPMYSMTDTLLCSEQLDEAQTRKVLSRIQQRSQRLLTFISEYSQLTQLPAPKTRWFSFSELLDEAKAMIDTTTCKVTMLGSDQCFGDRAQLTQVIINILKNAEQCQKNINVNINLYYQNDLQIVEINDTGPGFANLANVLTPFYTTKNSGSGIGLALCVEIIHNHNGQFSVNNNTAGGAKILMNWPLK
ncbi:sensor histidine kinase [Cognaticolwellia mytili]|uniref:sensor histidine kinase n=1 Tax=Cognaticolwellia mytili TaxID=1888913 RepID=UPI001F3905A2|nr:HAMP domain-containing sensor histidine kinase [Cognaticolwellia mytili]